MPFRYPRLGRCVKDKNGKIKLQDKKIEKIEIISKKHLQNGEKCGIIPVLRNAQRILGWSAAMLA